VLGGAALALEAVALHGLSKLLHLN
jgi:hypothetical protein